MFYGSTPRDGPLNQDQLSRAREEEYYKICDARAFHSTSMYIFGAIIQSLCAFILLRNYIYNVYTGSINI